MSGFRSVGLVRRAAALTVDTVAGLLVVAVGYGIGVLNPVPFRVEGGWFWTEWWLRYWIEDPGIFLTPVATLVISVWLWTAIWEGTVGRTPGDRVLGIEVVDEFGEPPGPVRAVVRGATMLAAPATLGLTWLWAFVSPARRAMHDVVSGTWVVRDS